MFCTKLFFEHVQLHYIGLENEIYLIAMSVVAINSYCTGHADYIFMVSRSQTRIFSAARY